MPDGVGNVRAERDKFFGNAALKHGSLEKKVLALVCLPLLVSLISSVVLVFLFKQADAEASDERSIRRTMEIELSIFRRIAELAGVSLLYTGNREAFLKERINYQDGILTNTLEEFRLAVKDDPVMYKHYVLALRATKKLQSMVFELVTVTRLGGSTLTTLRTLELRAKCLEIFKELQDDEKESRKVLTARLRKCPHLSEAYKTGILAMMGLTLSSNLVIALLAGRFLTRNVTRKLALLGENAQRLAEGQELLPAFGGDDEIGRLDDTFQQMARDLREALRTVRASEERFRSLLQQLPASVLLVNDRGYIQFANERSFELFGCAEIAISSAALADFVTVRESISRESTFFWLSVNAQAKVVEADVNRSDGLTRRVEISLVNITDADTQQFLCVLLDISEKQIAQKLRQQLVAMIAHDIRTPLSSIEMTLAIACCGVWGEVPESVKVKLEQAQNQGQRLVRLFNDLLRVEKSITAELDLKLQEMEIEGFVKESVEALLGKAAAHKVNLTFAGDQCIILADRDRLLQVLVNLLSNAIKFSPEGGNICIGWRVAEGNLCIEVIDEGSGLPEGTEESIFEPFKQVALTDSTEKGGAGLGLAICRSIVTSHGGTIGAHNNDLGGACFWLTLPGARKVEMAFRLA